MTGICMLYQGNEPHPAHKIFGEGVGCTYRQFETGRGIDTHHSATTGVPARVRTGLSLSADFDIVIAEGTAPLQTALVYATVTNRSATIVYLAADQTFHTLSDRPTRHLWKLIKPVANSRIDGCIAISNLVYQWGLPYHGQLPNQVVHPPMTRKRYEALSQLTPSSSQKPFRILSVGHARPMKNHRELVDAIAKLRSEATADIHLTLIGRGHNTATYANNSWVKTPGEIPPDDTESFVDYHGSASLYVQPSKADGFGIAVAEGMLSGTPTVATSMVGISDKLPTKCICSPTVDGLKSAINRQYTNTTAERVALGESNREAVIDMTVDKQTNEFRSAVEQFHTDRAG